MRLKNKRGLGTAATIILVILAIVVIGGGIYYYSSLSEGIVGDDKPIDILEQCVFACDTGQKTSFCDVSRKVDSSVTATCYQLATNSQYSKYNVQACPSIDCLAAPEGNSALAQDQTCTGLEGTWETPTAEGACPVKQDKFSRIRSPTDSPPVAGQICCYYYE